MACSHSDTIAYSHICPVYEGGSNMENSAFYPVAGAVYIFHPPMVEKT